MNPFAEIEVTPLFSKDGMKSQGQSVRIVDEDSSNGWNEIGVVSPNYLLVNNARVKDVVDEIAERSRITDWTQRKLWFDGRRFVYSITTDNITADVAPGDVIRFGLLARNSYDGSTALSVGAYAEHVICSNGMTSEMYFARFVFRHHQGNFSWDEQTTRAFQTVMLGSRAKLTSFARTLYTLKQKQLTMPDMQRIREKHLSDLSVNAWGRIVDRYLSHEQHTAFGLLDASTRIFWHNEKQTAADFRNNSYATDGMIQFAETIQN